MISGSLPHEKSLRPSGGLLWALKVYITLIVTLHLLLGIFIFPFYCYFRWANCILTDLENNAREKIGWPKIIFIRHYLIKPYIKLKRKLR